MSHIWKGQPVWARTILVGCLVVSYFVIAAAVAPWAYEIFRRCDDSEQTTAQARGSATITSLFWPISVPILFVDSRLPCETGESGEKP